MIQLRSVSLPVNLRLQLERYQATIDSLPDYASMVAAAKLQFKRRNTSRNATFRAVRKHLVRICSGARRCCYCEDSCADEIEHIKPKDLYPETTFSWPNYIYACGICNVRKSIEFAVFSRATGIPTAVARGRKDPVEPPEPGNPLLINPRAEDPFTFLKLDLLGTFLFVPISEPGSKNHVRARYTIDTLELNRDYLAVARRQAYISFRAELFEYIKRRDGRAPRGQLVALKRAIQTKGHASVWKEMVRQRSTIASLRDLFDNAPEAVGWRVGRSALASEH